MSLAQSLSLDVAAITALTRRDLLRFSRDRSQILGALGRPAIWMLLFATGMRPAIGGALAGLDYHQFAYAGVLAMTVLFSGMFQGVTVVWDREFGMLREVLVAPISRGSIALGKTFAGAAVTFVQGVIAAAFAPVVGVTLAPLRLLLLLPALALVSLGVTALGVAIGSRMRSFEGFGVISNFVVLPLYFLSGGLFPIDALPGWMRLIVLTNPMTYGVDLMRAAAGQPHTFDVVLDVTLVIAFAAGACALALAAFRRGDER